MVVNVDRLWNILREEVLLESRPSLVRTPLDIPASEFARIRVGVERVRPSPGSRGNFKRARVTITYFPKTGIELNSFFYNIETVENMPRQDSNSAYTIRVELDRVFRNSFVALRGSTGLEMSRLSSSCIILIRCKSHDGTPRFFQYVLPSGRNATPDKVRLFPLVAPIEGWKGDAESSDGVMDIAMVSRSKTSIWTTYLGMICVAVYDKTNE